MLTVNELKLILEIPGININLNTDSVQVGIRDSNNNVIPGLDPGSPFQDNFTNYGDPGSVAGNDYYARSTSGCHYACPSEVERFAFGMPMATEGRWACLPRQRPEYRQAGSPTL
ncbi:hypothetical protein ACFLU5_05980 [Bacteroidota bacterium]